MQTIYLDNASTTFPKPPEVAQAVYDYMTRSGANINRGCYAAAYSVEEQVLEPRQLLCEQFRGPDCRNVVFTKNVTESLNLLLRGFVRPGDHILVSAMEHNAVMRPLVQMGAQFTRVPCRPDGTLETDALEGCLRPNTRAVVCTHASNLTGDLMDLEKMADFAHKNGLLLILDASQTAGVFPIDMDRQGIDLVCFTGHKSLMGPQGTGGLCFREGLDIRPFAVGGTGVQSFLEHQPEEYPTRLEAGTLNSHGLAGLAAALDFLEETGMDAIRAHETALARRFYQAVRDLPGVRLYGDFTAPERAPIVTLNLGDYDSAEVADELAERFSVATRPGAHCAPRLHRCLGTENQGAVRFSWSWFNTEEETDAAAVALKCLAEEA